MSAGTTITLAYRNTTTGALYAEGLAYGRKCALTMITDDRLRDTERAVRVSPYCASDSPTRAYWLGFVRALRERRWHR